MTDKVKRERKKPASPAATGGAGPQFERRVAAIALARLITATHFPGVAAPLGQVGLQMRVHGYLFDDLVVFGGHGTDMLNAAWQIKLTMSVTASDEQFMEVVTAGLYTLADLHAGTSTMGPGVIGVIADGDAQAVDQLRQLHEIADGHSDSSTFDNVFQAGVIDVKVRNRLVEVRKAVEKAITQKAPALGDTNASTHALLAALHVWRPATADSGADYLSALNGLGPLAGELGISAHTLFAHIEDLGQRWAISAGVVRADRVLLRLQMITGLRRTLANDVRDAQAAALLPLDVTAIVLGPVDGHALRPAIVEAESLLEAKDAAAAQRFAAIAVQFEHAQFWPYANRMRRQQATALHATGQVEQAITLRADLAWTALDRLQAWDGRFALHDDRHLGDEQALTPIARRVWRCADAAVGYALGEDFDRFAAAFDALEPADPHRLRAAVFLCEEAMAQDQPSQILSRRAELETLLGQAVAGDAAWHLMIRGGMCLADATNGWDAFFVRHRRTVKPLVRAWLHARYARHLALVGEGAQAREHYLDAVDFAANENNLDDAADWLYALRTVAFWYEGFGDHEQHQVAQSLRPLATPSRLPGSQHAAEFAMREMSSPEPSASAEPSIRRWRWQAYVRGQLTDEMLATETLAMLLQREGRIEEALQECVRAGRNDTAKKIASKLPERTVRIEHIVPSRVSASQAAYFTVAAAAADQLPDADIQRLAESALALLDESGPPLAQQLGPSPRLVARHGRLSR